MQKNITFIILIAVSLFLTSCGQTNYFSWAASNKVSSYQSAQTALDDGKYRKAASILEDILAKDPNNKKINILYAQSLMGMAGVDLANFFDHLTTDNPAGNSPLLNLQATVASANRDLIYKAADIFCDYLPDETDDKLIGSICTLTAASTIMAQKFDPEGLGIENVTTDNMNSYTSEVDGNVISIWIDMKWSGNPSITDKHMRWISRSILLITSMASGDVNESIEEAENNLNTIQTLIDNNPGLPLYWAIVRFTLYGLQ